MVKKKTKKDSLVCRSVTRKFKAIIHQTGGLYVSLELASPKSESQITSLFT